MGSRGGRGEGVRLPNHYKTEWRERPGIAGICQQLARAGRMKAGGFLEGYR